jgi:hypothetical protein
MGILPMTSIKIGKKPVTSTHMGEMPMLQRKKLKLLEVSNCFHFLTRRFSPSAVTREGFGLSLDSGNVSP